MGWNGKAGQKLRNLRSKTKQQKKSKNSLVHLENGSHVYTVSAHGTGICF